MRKDNKFFIWMMLIVVAGMTLHYIILFIFKFDEPFFFLIAFGCAAAAITSWIFDFFTKKTSN